MRLVLLRYSLFISDVQNFGDKRLAALDAWKGGMLVMLTVNLLSGHPFKSITFEPVGFFGTAEGFVFLSGTLAGYVYGQPRFSIRQLAEKTVTRFSVIASCLIGIVLALPFLYSLFGAQPFQSIVVDSFPLPNPLGDGRILGLYCGLFLLVFPSLYLLKRNHWLLLVCVSTGLYLMSVYPDVVANTAWIKVEADSGIVRGLLFLRGSISNPFQSSPEIELPVGFSLIAWQLLFVLGVVSGYFYGKGKRFEALRRRNVLVGLFVVCIAFAFVRHFEVGVLFFPEFFFGRDFLGVFRLLNFCLFAAFVFGVSSKLPPFPRLKSLEMLGRNSLAVFTFQSLFVFGVLNHYMASISSKLLGGALVLVACSSIFVVGFLFDRSSWLRVLFKRNKFWIRVRSMAGLTQFVDWKRRIAFSAIVYYIVLSVVNSAYLREDFPFTGASMFARNVGEETPLYSLKLYGSEEEELSSLAFQDYSLNKRILLYSVYCGDEERSPYYNPACMEDAYSLRMERWFVQLHRRYIELHGETPDRFILRLEPHRFTGHTIALAEYDCGSGELFLADRLTGEAL